MPTSLRILLIIGALVALIAVSTCVKKSKILIEDATFWVVAAVILVVLALFPDAIIHLAFGLGFMSPANFVFLVIITMLLWKVFANSGEISRLKAKVNELAQEVALQQLKDDENKNE